MSNENKHYNRIIELFNTFDKDNRRRALEATIMYFQQYPSMPKDRRERLMEELLKDSKWMDEYANSFELDSDEKEVMTYDFEQRPEYMYRYEALANQLLKTKEDRQNFIDAHRTRLINVAIRTSAAQLYKFLNGKVNIDDMKYVTKKLTSRTFDKIPYEIVKGLTEYIEQKKIDATEEDYDALMGIVIMKEISV